MIPHTLVLKPGLVIHTIYNGYWFWGRPSLDDCGSTCARQPGKSARTGISAHPDSATPGPPAIFPFHGWDQRTAGPLTAT